MTSTVKRLYNIAPSVYCLPTEDGQTQRGPKNKASTHFCFYLWNASAKWSRSDIFWHAL